jgi:hypothetical protein
MLRDEEFPRDLGADPGPVRGRDRPIPGQTGRLIDRGDPFRDLDPERADIAGFLEGTSDRRSWWSDR